jgi:hypothetical protein
MFLTSLPETKNKIFHEYLEIGKKYEILGSVGDGYIIQPDGCKDRIIILASRFSEK